MPKFPTFPFLLWAALAAPSFAATALYEAPSGEPETAVREVAVTNFPAKWAGKPDRLWMELRCADSGEDMAEILIRGGRGAGDRKKGEYRQLADLPECGARGVTIPFGSLAKALDASAVSNVVVRTADGETRRIAIGRLVLLEEGEEPPAIDEAPRPRVRDAAAHHTDYIKFRNECRRGSFVIGWATGMESIRPRAAFKWRRPDPVCVRLARGERESVQILVAPAAHDLKDVRVSVVMEGGSGADFASSNVSVSVVGYVETRDPPPYKVRPKMVCPPRGWWPDPILGFQQQADIAGEDVQSYWLRVTCPEDQMTGVYTGRIVVAAENATTETIDFLVRVNDFAVGRVSPLPLAVSTVGPSAQASTLDGRKDVLARVKAGDCHQAWKTHEEQYCDFFADYYITWETIYGGPTVEPRWDMLVRLRDQGRLGMFNLCYWWYIGVGPGGDDSWRKNKLPIMRERYEKAKELGIADHAFFYGCDELGENVFSNIAAAVSSLHGEFPGVPVMTTARDRKLGTGGSLLRDVDIFCPATCFWHGRPVRQAQAEGRKVWWYFCNDPVSPFANTMIECPPAEIRSLMGAQAQKFKPDGFLYYQTMNWNVEEPIRKGPFTSWNPRSHGRHHGDGQWTCCGPDLLPLPTIRLENFRDGLEDLWYARLLEEKLRAVESGALKVEGASDWCRRAKAVLAVPNDVARRVSIFSTDPAVLYRWRDEMADLIEEAN